MESYIVRVYRRGRNDPNEVAGLVESVGSDERKTFQTFNGLVSAIRQVLGEDECGVDNAPQAHIYTDGDVALKKQFTG